MFFRKITDKILYYETNLKRIKEVSTHWNENQSLDIFVNGNKVKTKKTKQYGTI